MTTEQTVNVGDPICSPWPCAPSRRYKLRLGCRTGNVEAFDTATGQWRLADGFNPRQLGYIRDCRKLLVPVSTFILLDLG